MPAGVVSVWHKRHKAIASGCGLAYRSKLRDKCHLERRRKLATLVRLLKDQTGASAAEYALILAIVGGAIAIASIALGASVSGAMNRTSNCINEATSAACT